MLYAARSTKGITRLSRAERVVFGAHRLGVKRNHRRVHRP